ncbi:hypothetical protein AMECASPLE_037990 [Ameca splendens]|uniref:Uncharacterized protein n=1 Tax=Ameca splendens TaxID=208324 RepID=A0ABV0XX41_9TELE
MSSSTLKVSTPLPLGPALRLYCSSNPPLPQFVHSLLLSADCYSEDSDQDTDESASASISPDSELDQTEPETSVNSVLHPTVETWKQNSINQHFSSEGNLSHFLLTGRGCPTSQSVSVLLLHVSHHPDLGQQNQNLFSGQPFMFESENHKNRTLERQSALRVGPPNIR